MSLSIERAVTRGAHFGAVILAAGASTRMGSPKQLLELDGRPLVVRAAEAALDAGCWPVVVALGAQVEKIRPVLARLPVLVADTPDWSEGMAASIRAGVTTVRQFSRSLEGVVVALCDQPAFSADVIRQLIAAQRHTGRTIAAARYHGRCAAPALFTREHFEILAHLTGEAGARDLLNADPARVAAVELSALEFDFGTPGDIAAWEKSPARSAP